MGGARRVACRVTRLIDHGARTYTLEMSPASPVPTFRPGQFLQLSVDECDPASFWPESRAFSIASSPRDRSTLRVVYSVAGRYTEKMEAVLREGGVVWVKLPYGDFVVTESAHVTLVAGGTGISPFLAYLETLEPTAHESITLVYGTRCTALMPFLPDALSCMDRVPRMKLILFSEDEGPPPVVHERSAAVRWFCGPIDLGKVLPLLPAPREQCFYLSGPPSMLVTLGERLAASGIAAAQIKSDAWE